MAKTAAQGARSGQQQPKAVGNQLRQVRRKQGLSRAEVARSAGLTRRELASYERGRSPVPESDLWCLAGSCGVDVAELLPQRAPAKVSSDLGLLAVGDSIRYLRGPVDEDELLREYMSMIYELRNLPPGSRIPLRERDLMALADALGGSPEMIERRLVELIGMSQHEANRLCMMILPPADLAELAPPSNGSNDMYHAIVATPDARVVDFFPPQRSGDPFDDPGPHTPIVSAFAYDTFEPTTFAPPLPAPVSRAFEPPAPPLADPVNLAWVPEPVTGSAALVQELPSPTAPTWSGVAVLAPPSLPTPEHQIDPATRRLHDDVAPIAWVARADLDDPIPATGTGTASGFVRAGANWRIGGIFSSTAAADDGALSLGRADARWALADVSAPGDFTIEAAVDFTAGPGFGVLFRSTVDDSERIDGYSFDINSTAGGGGYFVRQWVENQQDSRPLAQADVPDPALLFGPHMVSMTLRGDQLNVLVDDATVLMVPSLSLGSVELGHQPCRGAAIGVQAWATTEVTVDSFRVARA